MPRPSRKPVERIDVSEVARLVDDPRVRSGLGLTDNDAVLRLLAECACVRGHDNEVAVFRAQTFDYWTAIIFDTAPPFADLVLEYLFGELGAKTLQFSTADRESGKRLGGYFKGPYMNLSLGFAWTLTREDWIVTRSPEKAA